MIRSFSADDTEALVELWRRCELLRPWNDPHDDIERKLATDPDLLLVAIEDGAVVGSAMVGYDGHRGWVNYLAVDPDSRRRGIGRSLMTESERLLTDLGCPKLNLQIRTENAAAVEFYARLGYRVEGIISMGRRL
jgi:ribosomal protein S18 acetylase RimI-like enzyme